MVALKTPRELVALNAWSHSSVFSAEVPANHRLVSRTASTATCSSDHG
jgi:hypothetical protein